MSSGVSEPDKPDPSIRLSLLEERVARLEEQAAGNRPRTAGEQPAATEAAPGVQTLWALNELKARMKGAGAVLYTGSVTLPSGKRYEWQFGVPADQLLDEDWAGAGDVLAALAHPVRLTLLRQVLNGADTTAELGALEELGTSGQLYHHLRQLVSAGWLRQAARGRYEVPPARVVPLLVIITATQR
jgi:hypothetical protein